MNTDTMVLLIIFSNEINFQVAKVQPQGAFASFFANFSLALLIKVLLIKKECNCKIWQFKIFDLQ